MSRRKSVQNRGCPKCSSRLKRSHSSFRKPGSWQQKSTNNGWAEMHLSNFSKFRCFMLEIAQFFLFLAGLLPLGLNDLPQISISWHNDSHCSLTLECILSYLHFIAFCCCVLYCCFAALLMMAALLEL